jgi:hypothetical protein
MLCDILTRNLFSFIKGTSSSASTLPTPSSTVESKPSPKSLSESAAAYYESHATPKRKYDQVSLKINFIKSSSLIIVIKVSSLLIAFYSL